jgi:hypothetical protein
VIIRIIIITFTSCVNKQIESNWIVLNCIELYWIPGTWHGAKEESWNAATSTVLQVRRGEEEEEDERSRMKKSEVKRVTASYSRPLTLPHVSLSPLFPIHPSSLPHPSSLSPCPPPSSLPPHIRSWYLSRVSSWCPTRTSTSPDTRVRGPHLRAKKNRKSKFFKCQLYIDFLFSMFIFYLFTSW